MTFGIATLLQAEWPRNRVSILLRAKSDTSSLDSGIHPTFYCVDTGVVYPEHKRPGLKLTATSGNHE